MRIRKADDRGLTQIRWLSSRHSFSFGDYYDPKNMGFRALRVINDDIIAKGSGFGMHGHHDMEIITLVVDGELEHKDSLGHTEKLRPGEVQVMTAGRGIRHSEYNPSSTKDAHIIQIWIEPREPQLPPSYAQKEFSRSSRKNAWVRVAGPTPIDDGALLINQDAHVFVSTLSSQGTVSHLLTSGRGAWIHITRGVCTVNGTRLVSGDAVALEDAGEIVVSGEVEETEVILFDLP
jgi:redox-sensitive bicupin YhaK (pirin superfamily)